MNKTSKDTQERINKSQKYFNPIALILYDFIVYDIITPLFWGFPISTLIGHYKRNLKNNHLEVGVGTGILLKNSLQRSQSRLGLMDLSQSCLDKSKQRLQRYLPEIYRQNILIPINQSIPKFDSIGINYVMHCIPGSFSEKGLVFKHLKALLNEGGVLFGSSLMFNHKDQGLFSKFVMRLLNIMGIFNNSEDTSEALEIALRAHFNDVQIVKIGSATLFSAR